jgi:hypothetical protein
MSRQMCCVAAGTGAGTLLDTHRRASFGHPRCREIATCVHDPGPCEPPVGRPRNSSEPGYEGRSQAVRGSLADRIREGEKRLCCVTTRRCNFWFLNILRYGLGLLTARFLCLGMLGLDFGVLPAFGLPPRRLPAANLT